MPHSYGPGTLVWSYPDAPGRWIFSAIALFAFLGLSFAIASHLLAPAPEAWRAARGATTEANLWLNIGGMLLSAWLLFVLVKPPASGSFLVKDSEFEYDSGKRPADVLGYITGDFPGVLNLFRSAADKTPAPRFVPRRTRLRGGLGEISDLRVKSGPQGLCLLFRFRDKDYEFASGLPSDELQDIYQRLSHIIPPKANPNRTA